MQTSVSLRGLQIRAHSGIHGQILECSCLPVLRSRRLRHPTAPPPLPSSSSHLKDSVTLYFVPEHEVMTLMTSPSSLFKPDELYRLWSQRNISAGEEGIKGAPAASRFTSPRGTPAVWQCLGDRVALFTPPPPPHTTPFTPPSSPSPVREVLHRLLPSGPCVGMCQRQLEERTPSLSQCHRPWGWQLRWLKSGWQNLPQLPWKKPQKFPVDFDYPLGPLLLYPPLFLLLLLFFF